MVGNVLVCDWLLWMVVFGHLVSLVCRVHGVVPESYKSPGQTCCHTTNRAKIDVVSNFVDCGLGCLVVV